MAKVYAPETAGVPRGERLFGPVERVIYRLTGVDAEREQRWTVYARSLLAFSLVSVLVVYLLQRVQGGLPLNPTDVGAVPEPLAFNTAVSFVTNTNWQNYAGEITMSHLTQMAGARRAELRVGRRRHGGGRGARAWPGASPVGHHRQLLGRPHPVGDPRPAAAVGHRRAGAGEPGRDPEPERVHGRPHARGRGRSSSPAGRRPARRSSRSWAPTAAGSSTPTRATRSAAPTGSRTCCRCS